VAAEMLPRGCGEGCLCKFGKGCLCKFGNGYLRGCCNTDAALGMQQWLFAVMQLFAVTRLFAVMRLFTVMRNGCSRG